MLAKGSAITITSVHCLLMLSGELRKSQRSGIWLLPLEKEIGREYISAMEWCMAFAELNRQLMMERLLNIFTKVTGGLVK